MPRLHASLLRIASAQSVFLPSLLRECRDLSSARNELRWLKEYVFGHHYQQQHQQDGHHDARRQQQQQRTQNRILRQYVARRAKGEPLQYILGTQPFGDLEILCRKHVLIPRPETEVYTTKIAELLLQARVAGVITSGTAPFRIADLCTGTGCIALLMHSILCPVDVLQPDHASLKRWPLQIHGFDISPHALALANANLLHNRRLETLHKDSQEAVAFHHLDVLDLGDEARAVASQRSPVPGIPRLNPSAFLTQNWDVIVSNPPYISPSDYAPGGTTTRSVRMYEPKLALVPPLPKRHETERADQFYEAILHIAQAVNSKLVVMEIGDSKQAGRVRKLAADLAGPNGENLVLETWRDDGSVDSYILTDEGITRRDVVVEETDRGHERAIVLWKGSFGAWRRSSLM